MRSNYISACLASAYSLVASRRRGLATNILLFCCLAAPAALAQTSVVEPATGSLWLSTGGGLQGQLLGEWHRDGSFTADKAPFSPFKSSKGGLFSGVTPMRVGAAFFINVDLEHLYQRTAQGRWEAHSVAAFLPSDVTCNRLLASGERGCLIAADGTTDNRGETSYIVGTQDNNSAGAVRLYVSASGWRHPRGAERWLISDDDDVRWLNADTALIPGSTSNGLYTYTVVTAKGRASQSVVIPGSTNTSMGDAAMLVSATGQVYVSQTITDQSTGAYAQKIYRMDEPATKPDLTMVALLSDAGYSSILALNGDHHFYYNTTDGRVKAFDLSTKQATLLKPCNAAFEQFLPDDQPAASRQTWVACGDQVLGLSEGQIERTIQAAGPITSGRVLAHDGDGAELILQLAENRYQRIYADGTSQLLDLGVRGSPGPLWPSWEEGGVICGVSNPAGNAGGASTGAATPTSSSAGTAASAVPGTSNPGFAGDTPPAAPKVMCQKGAGWTERSGMIPYETLHVPGQTWALADDGSQFSLYSLAENPAAAWQLKQSWPHASANSTLALRPRLIRHGISRVAIDIFPEAIWVLEGEHWAPSYPHARVQAMLRPALDEDGNLYDACVVDASTTGLCVFDRTGSKSTVLLDHNGPVLPLKHGMLYGGKYGGYYVAGQFVIRGSHAIALAHLYGQLSTEGDSFSVTSVYLGDGTVMINRSDPGGLTTYFRFDGSTLTPVAHGYLPVPEFGSTTSTTTSFPSDGDSGVDISTFIPEAWLGPDGLWRRADPSATPRYSVKKTAVDTVLGDTTSHTNWVNAAVVLNKTVWSAGDQGLYTCPLGKGTPLGAATMDLPATPGCNVRLPLPYGKALRVVGKQLVFWQGDRVLLLTPGAAADGSGDTMEILSSGQVSSFGADAADSTHLELAWVQNNRLQTMLLPGKTDGSIDLPTGVTADSVKAVAPHWLCAVSGLYFLGSGAWEKLTPSCKALTASQKAVLMTDGDHAYVCSEGQCGSAISLPESYLEDTVLGTLAGPQSFAWISGRHVYRLGAAGFAEATPEYEGGSALLTKANSCEGGLISLAGGGIVGTVDAGDAAPAWWLVRLE